MNAKNGDSYTFNPTQSQTGAWAGNPTGDVTYELDFKNNAIELNGTDGKTEAFLTHKGHGAMLVPQTLTPWDGKEVVENTAPFDGGSYHRQHYSLEVELLSNHNPRLHLPF